MCGIAGITDFSGTLANQSITSMLSMMARRGPDAESTKTWQHTVLGHRRLAILDLSEAGLQPMLSDDSQIGIVFNGCIYNFLELRKELQQLGHNFRSTTDTEVLLRGYQQWGIADLLPKLRGMFAFCIWDAAIQTLFMARDRLGVKPLYFLIENQRLAFASTLPALLTATNKRQLNELSLLHYLEYGFVSDSSSIYKDVGKIQPGHWASWSLSGFSTQCYWNLRVGEHQAIHFDEAVEKTEHLLLESVRHRLVSDVPIGALLSGGVDSTLICWALTKLNTNVRCFTIGTPGHETDESGEALATARALGLETTIIEVHETLDLPLDDLFTAYSEPFSPESALGMMSLAQVVKNDATVLLTGDGGDELFLGYSFMRNAWRAQKLARFLPKGSDQLWQTLRPSIGHGGPLRRAQSFLSYSFGGLGAFARLHDGLPLLRAKGILGERLAFLELHARSIPPSMESARCLLDELLRFHQSRHFTGEFLPKVDGATMFYSLEARSPMLDHVLWEFGNSLPYAIRCQGGNLKAVLRAIVGRRISQEVAARKKRGFSIPVQDWLSTRWANHRHMLREHSLLAEDGWLQREALNRMIGDRFETRAVPVQLWRIVLLESWYRRSKTPPAAVL
jgi:asparagine synthase (glutamine-hydrolysing)